MRFPFLNHYFYDCELYVKGCPCPLFSVHNNLQSNVSKRIDFDYYALGHSRPGSYLAMQSLAASLIVPVNKIQ